MIIDGDAAALVYTYRGTSAGILPDLLPARGEEFLLEVCGVLRFRDGKLASQVDYC
ncbi:ketosteroid isomerase-like protein [Microlunatus parietis]|uniref:Ketosteroid isomerase-like protein n=2 Tax=Microlunatus parietis TaxID=682979 RepID=A0A7Y9I2K7_9ACTN|nr:ketosteroid isomerase-like protein [Microlunatus parietis]